MQKNGLYHKSSGVIRNKYKTLTEKMKEFEHFNRFIHRVRTLKLLNVFAMIVEPVCKRPVFHSPVIHSSRSLVRFFRRLLQHMQQIIAFAF